MLASVVQVVVQAVCGFVTSTLMPTIQAIAPFVTAIVGNITQVLRGITGVVKGVVDLVAGIINGDWRRAWNGFRGIVGGAWNIVAGVLSGVGNFILGCFAGAGTWLVNAGRSIINGLLSGLRSAFAHVKHFVSGIGDWIVRHKGPISYDRRMLIPAGHAIMGGFDQALRDGWQDVQRTVNGMNAQINGGFDVDASKSGRANVSNGGGSTTYVQQTFNYPAIAPTSISTQQKLQTAAMPQW